MPRNIEVYNLLDFTGGLNLEQDQFKLRDSESPDLCNVDISYRGGITHRKGYHVWGGGETKPAITDMHAWYGHVDGPCVVYAHDGGEIMEQRANQAAVSWTTKFPGSEGKWLKRRIAAEFKNDLFLANPAGDSVIKLQSNGLVEITTPMADGDFNNDLDNPKNGRFPLSKVIASWMGSMWAANVYEGTTAKRHPNRVRWSHLNFPNDWHADHYVDVGDDDGGEITALIPDGERLLVFRERSVHAIVGSPPEAIQVYEVTATLGCVSHEKVCGTPFGVYFWDESRGVYKITSNKIEWVFEKIYPHMVTGRLDGAVARAEWGGDRLYALVDYKTEDLGATYKSWFVFDPGLGKHGAWTRHAFTADPRWDNLTVPVKQGVWFAPPDGESQWLVAIGSSIVYRNEDEHDDSFPQLGAYTQSNRAWFTTAWIDLDQPGQLKRWRRADIFGWGLDPDNHLDLEVFQDYDHWTIRRRGEIHLADLSRAALAKFGTAVWGTDTWAAPSVPTAQIERTAPLGRCRAVQLRFHDKTETASLPWGLDSLAIKFTPLRIRG